MLRYLSIRVLSTIPVLVFVGLLIFSLLHLMPGDPALLIAGDNASPEQVETIRASLHLDQSLPVQFVIWANDLIHLDFGQSVFTRRPVIELIGQRIQPTVVLAITATLLAALVAVPLGILAAYRSHTLIDRGVIALSVAGFSIPVFVIGYALIYVLAVRLHWLPVQGYKPLSDGLVPCLRSIALPSLSLALLMIGLIARITRATMLEILDEDYIRTARAKGALTMRVLFVHALKNAGPPVITIIGIGFAGLLGGVVVTETVFNIPGMGRLTTDAIMQRDYPVVQGVMLTFALMLIGVNLLIDLTYPFFDPRVRY
jgi:peptide/nickel transport system permease protein